MKHLSEKVPEAEKPRNVLTFAATAIGAVLLIVSAILVLFSGEMPIVQE